jgi:hypothetical protein
MLGHPDISIGINLSNKTNEIVIIFVSHIVSLNYMGHTENYNFITVL